MTDKKISGLPLASALTGNELVPIVQNGTTCQTPASSFGISNMVLLASGTITSPVPYIDLALPAGYILFQASLVGFKMSLSTNVYFAASTNGGLTFFNDPVNFDTYGAILSSYSVTGAGDVVPFSIGGNRWDALAPLQRFSPDTGGTNDVALNFYPGDSTTSFRAQASSIVNGTNSGNAFADQCVISSWLNLSATVPPVLGRVNLIRLLSQWPPEDSNPPTSGVTITAGSYILWGISPTASIVDADSTPTNAFVNPAMQVDQINEGAVVSYTVGVALRVLDQWAFEIESGDATATAQRVTDAPAGISHSVKITITAANSTPGTTTWSAFEVDIEPNRFEGWQWGTANAQTVSLSFWMKCSINGTFTAGISPLVANAPPNFLAGFSVLAGVWTYCEVQIPGETTSSDWVNGLFFAVVLAISPVIPDPDRAWSNDVHFVVAGQTMLTDHVGATVQFTGFKLEPTPVATPFYQASFATDLIECQRYYRKTFPQGTKPAQNAGINGALTTINPVASGYPSVMWEFGSMVPASASGGALNITTYNPSATNANWRDVTGAANVTVSVDPAGAAGSTSNASAVLLTTSAPVATAGHVLAIHAVADAWF